MLASGRQICIEKGGREGKRKKEKRRKKGWRERGREWDGREVREEERVPICFFTLHMVATARARPGGNQEPAILSLWSSGFQQTKYLGHLPVFPKMR